MGILLIRALPFWIYIRAHEFWKLPSGGWRGELQDYTA